VNVPLSRPDITDLEIEYVTGVLRSGQLSMGPRVLEFEDKFARRIGRRFAVAANSGTSALHLAARALGIGPGDEVITSSFSFVASANCALFVGAEPVFVDIDPLTYNFDPRAIERFLVDECIRDPRTGHTLDTRTGRWVKAILPVDVFGLACEMDAIQELAQAYGLRVLEDACESLGATYHERPVGSFGDAAVFAFYPNKQMTTGEGGMIVTDNESLAAACRSMCNQGRDPQADWLCHARLGYNYRLSDIHAALGLAQLERLEELLAGRARVAELYHRGLSGHPLIRLPYTPAGVTRSWFAYVIQILAPSGEHPALLRDNVLAGLRARGIGCQVYFPAIHLQPYFQENGLAARLPLRETERASAGCLALPMFSTATDEQIGYVCQTLLELLEKESTGVARLSHGVHE